MRNIFNDLFTVVWGWIGSLLAPVFSLLGPNIGAKWSDVIEFLAGWNQVLPLAALFGILVPTFILKVHIRLVAWVLPILVKMVEIMRG